MTFKNTLIAAGVALALVYTSTATAGWFKDFIKKPAIALNPVVEAVANAPVKVIEESAKVIARNTGGDVEKIATNVHEEAARTRENVHAAVEGTGAALTQLRTDPDKGLPRVLAAGATAGSSEILIHKRAEKIRREKQQEFNEQVRRMEEKQQTGFENLVNQRIIELEQDAARIRENIALLDDAITFSMVFSDTDSADDAASAVPAELATLATAANEQLVLDYLEQLDEVIGKGLDVDKSRFEHLVTLKQAIVVVIEANGVTLEQFVSTIAATSKAEARASSMLATAQDAAIDQLVELQMELTQQLEDIALMREETVVKLEVVKTNA